MKVLVTGGAGYIGSHTAQQLLDAGHDVVVLDNLTTGFRDAVPSECEFVHGDVRKSELVEKILRHSHVEAVIHFAAKLIVPESVECPIDYYENNTMGVLSLVKACVAARVSKVVFSSTAAVYGNENIFGSLNEDTKLAPLSPYGESKLMSEKILRDCEKPYGIRSISLRYFNVAGAAINGFNGQRTKNATHLIKVASEAACGKRSHVSIFGTDYQTLDGTGVRDYIHVEDLADLHVLALQYLNNGGRSDVFNCGYGHGFSVREVVQSVIRNSGVKFSVKEEVRRAGDADILIADTEKIRKTLNWKPKRDNLDLICRSAYDWEKSQQLKLESGDLKL